MRKMYLGCLSGKWADSQRNVMCLLPAKILPLQMSCPNFWSILDSIDFKVHPTNDSQLGVLSTPFGPANVDGCPPVDQFLS